MWTCGTKLQTLKSASRILGQIYIYCIRAPFFSHTQPFLYHDTHFSNHFHYPSLTKQYSSTSQLGTVSHPIPHIHQVTYDHGHSSLLESSQNTSVRVNPVLGSSLTTRRLPGRAPMQGTSDHTFIPHERRSSSSTAYFQHPCLLSCFLNSIHPKEKQIIICCSVEGLRAVFVYAIPSA